MDLELSPSHKSPYRQYLIVALSTAAITLSAFGMYVHEKSSKEWNVKALHAQIALSQNQLERTVANNNLTVYWAGPRAGYLYLLNNVAKNRLILSYISATANPKNIVANSRVIATYNSAHAFANTVAAAGLIGNTGFRNSDGSVVFYQTNRKTDVYIGFPHAQSQVEIYDPTIGQALSLAILQGQISEVGKK